MMLSAEEDDEFIKKLIQFGHPLCMEFILQLNAHLIAQVQNKVPLPADNLITLLNQLRTTCIQKDSVQRFECSKQEQIYFAKLQDFFVKMYSVYELVKNADFEKRIQAICVYGTYEEQLEKYFDDTHPYWKKK